MSSIEKAKALLEEIKEFGIESKEVLEEYRIKYIGSKGEIKNLFALMRETPNEVKRDFGQMVNEVKQIAENKFNEFKVLFEQQEDEKGSDIDLTLDADDSFLGSRHPISIVRDEMINIFSRIGFAVAEGPELEDDWHNFTALNTPEDHPARDMQDTFYVQTEPVALLRTHTSSVQTRVMQKQSPPIRIICPGRVYRNETISARAHCQFHQIEGLYIDKDVSFADLKQTLLYFAQSYFGEKTKIRIRPSYFPFTEPSAEVDISCFICNQEGCSICKKTGWVEIGGCGMVDPNVLDNCEIDSKEYSGFAFGMGIDRTAMLKFKIDDIRLFFQNDVRFLRQFASEA